MRVLPSPFTERSKCGRGTPEQACAPSPATGATRVTFHRATEPGNGRDNSWLWHSGPTSLLQQGHPKPGEDCISGCFRDWCCGGLEDPVLTAQESHPQKAIHSSLSRQQDPSPGSWSLLSPGSGCALHSWVLGHICQAVPRAHQVWHSHGWRQLDTLGKEQLSQFLNFF